MLSLNALTKLLNTEKEKTTFLELASTTYILYSVYTTYCLIKT